jgi:hypothetical protein
MTEDSVDKGAGSIEILNMMRWSAEPRLGAFTVVIDGTPVGEAPAFGRGYFPATIGQHKVNVTLRHFSSSVVSLNVTNEHVQRLAADRRGKSPYVRLIHALLEPKTALSLGVLVPGRDDGISPPARDMQRSEKFKSRTKRVKPVMQLAFTLIVLGLFNGVVIHRSDVLTWTPLILGISLFVGCIEWIRRRT